MTKKGYIIFVIVYNIVFLTSKLFYYSDFKNSDIIISIIGSLIAVLIIFTINKLTIKK